MHEAQARLAPPAERVHENLEPLLRQNDEEQLIAPRLPVKR